MKRRKDKIQKGQISMVEVYYKKISRLVEYYVILCFVLITFVPLLNFGWVPVFIRFIYFTGFPLLIILILFSLIKDSFLAMLKRLFEPEESR